MPIYEVRFKLTKGADTNAVLKKGAEPIGIKDVYAHVGTFGSQTEAILGTKAIYGDKVMLLETKDTRNKKSPLFGQITVLKLNATPRVQRRLIESVVIRIYKKSDGLVLTSFAIDWPELRQASGVRHGDMVENMERWLNSKTGNKWLADREMGR